METLGERITKARERLNINQKEFCKKTGIKESTLSRYENNIREPKLSTLVTLAKELNVSFDYLFGVTDDFEFYTEMKSTPQEKNIEKILENTEKSLSQQDLLLNNKPVSSENLIRLTTALKVLKSLMQENS